MGLQETLDAHFPTHGNWDGLSLGQVAVLWLAHLLSQGSHCLSHVQPWAEQHWETLVAGLGHPFRVENLTDDRLAAVLRYFSQDEEWQACERALNQRALRVYALEASRVRLDSTTVRSFGPVSEGGLYQFGHSKDARKDLPILKLMAATLDPLSLPLVTTVLSGEHADDPLYVPAITEVREGLGQRGLLYVGDSKMGALATRAFTARGQDFYLCPLEDKHLAATPLETFLDQVRNGEHALHSVFRRDRDGALVLDPDQQPVEIATGFEVTLSLTDTSEAEPLTWEERRLVVRSAAWAESGTAALRRRVAQAVAAGTELDVRRQGKPRLRERAAVETAVEKIETRYRVAGLLRWEYTETVQERTIRARGKNPTRQVEEREVTVTVSVNAAALAEAEARLGWRVYATNAPATRLSLAEGVQAYREQYQIEHSFGRLKGRPLSITPMYLQRDDHATGLVRLLSLGLRVLSVLEFQVRRALAANEETLVGLYPGNPKRKTQRPSAELLLRAFGGVTLTRVPHPDDCFTRHLTPLTPLQKQILSCLGWPETLYTGLAPGLAEPP